MREEIIILKIMRAVFVIVMIMLMIALVTIPSNAEEISRGSTELDGDIKIDIYKSSELADKFETTEVIIDNLSAQDVVDALSENSVLPSNIKVNKFEQIGDRINLDVSDTLSYKLKHSGTTGERYTMGSLVNTILAAYNAREIKVTANGEIIETGHTRYDEYMIMYK